MNNYKTRTGTWMLREGKELDAIICEKILHQYALVPYSTEVNHALDLAQTMKQLFNTDCYIQFENDHWSVQFRDATTRGFINGRKDKSLAMAICIAAIKASGIDL